jgi:hypothetical protein
MVTSLPMSPRDSTRLGAMAFCDEIEAIFLLGFMNMAYVGEYS